MEKLMDDTTFTMAGYTIDLDELYRAMHAQSVLEGGIRVFHRNSNNVRAVKRLLHDLFDVMERDTMHPVNNRISKEAGSRMAALCWATKDPGRSARYELHRRL
jgi:hypothetical protein